MPDDGAVRVPFSIIRRPQVAVGSGQTRVAIRVFITAVYLFLNLPGLLVPDDGAVRVPFSIIRQPQVVVGNGQMRVALRVFITAVYLFLYLPGLLVARRWRGQGPLFYYTPTPGCCR